MIDLITHVPDIYAMNEEGLAIAQDENHPLHSLFTVDDNGELTFNVSKIPVHYTEQGETLCLVRGMEVSAFDNCESIVVLGECIGDTLSEKEYVFPNEEAKSTYERVRGSLEYTYVDEDGTEVIGYHPYMIGVFG